MKLSNSPDLKPYFFPIFTVNCSIIKIMKATFIFTIVVISVFFSSCKKSVKTYFDTGELKEVIEITDDSLRNGKYIRYHISGKVAEEVLYEKGMVKGVKKLFFENGKVEQESNYEGGQMNGFHKVYYESGKIKVDASVVNGQFSGPFKKYYENGQLEEVVTFVDDIENGSFEEFYQNGKLKWKGTYLNGDNEFGLLEHFDSTGVLVKTMNCDSMAVCRTTWKKEGFVEPENN